MFDEMENKLFSDIADLPNVYFLKSQIVDEKYPSERLLRPAWK